MSGGGLLALDIATNTGWAYARVPHRLTTALEAAQAKPPQPQSGTYRVRGVGIGPALDEYERWLTGLLNELRPAGVIFEAPVLSGRLTSLATARKLYGLAGLTEMVAHRAGIEWVREAQPASVKKHFAGNGRAKKPDMEAACRQRGWTFADDNEADALAVWDYGCAILHDERRRRAA